MLHRLCLLQRLTSEIAKIKMSYIKSELNYQLALLILLVVSG
ncbi:hypothetical protein SAMD00079811_48260 [Scytonema sp. HK-05]|nr:hypothetical protein SAMD00079811_48260 [Scytonema sp. HK-05]